MNLIWGLHRRLKKMLPDAAIKKIRYFIEVKFDFLWQKKYYGQFGEDAFLQALFESDTRQEPEDPRKGFYVDVGAYAPKQYSNTYRFYKMGWRGINIDATPGSMEVFNKARKRDINLEIAVSDKEQEVSFYTWGTPTVCNTISREHAEKFAKLIGKEPEVIKIKTKKLCQVLDDYLPAGTRIDFLTIDVENHNLEVLRSNNWEKYRPAIVVIEVDEESVEKILNSEIVAFMKMCHYRLCGWMGPSIFFEINNPTPENRRSGKI